MLLIEITKNIKGYADIIILLYYYYKYAGNVSAIVLCFQKTDDINISF